MRKLLALILLCIPSVIHAATFTCDGTQADCQAKANAAVNGDTIVWNVTNTQATPLIYTGIVSTAGKSLTFQGQGCGDPICGGTAGTGTFICSNAACNGNIKLLYAQTGTNPNVRITGFAFNGFVHIDASNVSNSSYGWRVDHNQFFGITNGDCSEVFGITWGLFDHDFFNNVTCDAVHVSANTPSDNSGVDGFGSVSWSLPLNLGTKEAVYVEDNVFLEPCNSPLAANDMDYGSRMVFRHNTVTNAYFQSHSARNSNRGGSLKFEVYNNVFNGTGTGCGANPALRPFLMLAGTGVVFNNQVFGYTSNNMTFGDQRAAQQVVGAWELACDGTHAWDQNIQANGWPCLDQIGRGSNGGQGFTPGQPTVPVIMWHNGPELTCTTTGGTCTVSSFGVLLNGGPVSLATYIQATAHSNGDIDYCNGTSNAPATCGNYTNNFTPFTYPHPLQNASPNAPCTACFVSTPAPIKPSIPVVKLAGLTQSYLLCITPE